MRHFTWDPIKAWSNLRKHGVAFEDAIQVFLDPNNLCNIDNYESGEERLKTIGKFGTTIILSVIHTTIDEDGDEYIRIISARQATQAEENVYSKALGSRFD
jgi:uncharacterized protein